MKNLKTLCLAVVVYFLLPLAVSFIENRFLKCDIYEMNHIWEEHSASRR